MKSGNNGIQNQTLLCASTISVKFNEPTQSITFIKMNPMDTSYDTICAADLKAPRKAYLELLAQPEINTP